MVTALGPSQPVPHISVCMLAELPVWSYTQSAAVRLPHMSAVARLLKL